MATGGGGLGGLLANLGRRAEAVREVAADIGQRVGEGLRERRGTDARAELARLWRQIEALVEDQATPAASRLARSAGEYAHEGRELAVEAAARLRSVTRSHPLLMIGIAVAATLAVTSLLGGIGRERGRDRGTGPTG